MLTHEQVNLSSQSSERVIFNIKNIISGKCCEDRTEDTVLGRASHEVDEVDGGGVRQTSVEFVRLARGTGEEHPKWRDQHLLKPRGRMK